MICVNNVYVQAISTSVPKSRVSNFDLATVYGEQDTEKLVASIGVKERRVSDGCTSTADLCYDAATNIFKNTDLCSDDVQAVIFISQTPDYQLPATACVLQNRLNLPKHCLAFDVNLGCSGYIYGLHLAASLVSTGLNNILLLVGDTISKLVEPGDRSTELLFGDAGTASIISHHHESSLAFEFGSDGSGREHIVAKKWMPGHELREDFQNGLYLKMNGGEVFSFTLRTVPKLVNSFIEELNLKPSEISNCFYHQANLFMLKHLLKKSGFKSEQVPVSMEKFGNTSGASIPLSICALPQKDYKNTLLVGFGVGLSWGIAFGDLTNTTILPVKDYSHAK